MFNEHMPICILIFSWVILSKNFYFKFSCSKGCNC